MKKINPFLAKERTVGDMDSGTECTLSRFVDNIKFCGAVNVLEGKMPSNKT